MGVRLVLTLDHEEHSISLIGWLHDTYALQIFWELLLRALCSLPWALWHCLGGRDYALVIMAGALRVVTTTTLGIVNSASRVMNLPKAL